MYSKRKLIVGFSRWLEMMNYVKSSLEEDPKGLAIFLNWMEENGVENIEQILGSKVKQFFKELSERKSQYTGQVLSLATQRNYLTTVNRFAKYLRHSGQGNIEVPIKFKGKSSKKIEILTKQEINLLYEQCDDSLLGIRDRAMLGLFYGCGVRKNEGAKMLVRDVFADRNLLYISHGKGYKQRYVPMIGQVKSDVISYLATARPMLLNKQVHEYFFVGVTGSRLGGSSMYERFRKLVKRSGMKKQVGLHALRHSIATHLLMNGMKLSEIAKFLGHSSLESTQIYTHLKDGL